MTLLGIEMSDAGIIAAGGEPAQLLAVEGGEKESPGFALSHKDNLIMGKMLRTRHVSIHVYIQITSGTN